VIEHAVPRTVGEGSALCIMRFILRAMRFIRPMNLRLRAGLPQSPLDDLAAFHVVFGKTVPDISLNAVANLGLCRGALAGPCIPAIRCALCLK
jgi:2-methylfumaryl-CoA hydratase